jgi:hypothetical protein
MKKLLWNLLADYKIFGTTLALAVSLIACNSDSNTASSPSPSPSGVASAPVPSSTSPVVTPLAVATPLIVPQNDSALADAGLIKATNPDQQVKELEALKQNPKKAPPQSDPFSPVLPPSLTPQSSKTDETRLTSLPGRKVPSLPELPTLTPPRLVLTSNITPSSKLKIPGPIEPQNPTLIATGIPDIPKTPVGNIPPRWGGEPSSVVVTDPEPTGIRNIRRNSIRKIPVGPPNIPPIATQPAGVPELPKLPTGNLPPQWGGTPKLPRGGIQPVLPPTIPPIAIQPVGVPELPKLPAGNSPPQWIDPNPPVVRGAPLPPSTDIAEGVEVSGVVQVGDKMQVILKVPEEPTSRYVSIGQRLANGQVLVKRVNLQSIDPIVIFEQNGVEVAKIVGEKNPEEDDKTGGKTTEKKDKPIRNRFPLPPRPPITPRV